MTSLTFGPRPFLRGAGLISWLLLAGCTSVQLPTWPDAREAGVAPAATLSPSQTIALDPPALEAAPSAAAQGIEEPAGLYDTPGLSPGRLAWSSPSELAAWLLEQARQSQRTAPGQAAVLTIGTSQAGLPIEALVLTRGASTDAAALKATERPTVMLLAQQHGNAPASAEALMVIARQLVQGELRPLLSRINVLIVPRANPDGAAKATRLTENGFDMAHDHLVLETPEAQALAKLARDYQPIVLLEAHDYPAVGAIAQKFGGLAPADAWVAYASVANLPEFLTKAAEEWFRQPLVSALSAEGLSSEWPQRTIKDKADTSIAWGDQQPDSSRNMNGLKNRISLTVASHGADLERRDSQRRVHAHITAITSVLNSTADRASELAQLKPYLDLEVIGLACQKERIIEAHPTPVRRILERPDPETESAGLLRGVKTRVSPCGYWLSAEATQAVERLRLHGVRVMRVMDTAALLGDFYQVPASAESTQAANGAASAGETVSIELLRGVVDAPAGSYYVALDQALGNLISVALEPDTPNSYFSQALIDELRQVARVMAQPAANLREVP